MFIHGIGIPIIVISRTIIIQKNTSNEIQGRIFSLFQISITGATALSIFFTGFILNYIKINLLYFIIGILGSICSLLLIIKNK